MIRSTPFELTAWDYFKLIASRYIRRRWWLSAALAALGVAGILMRNGLVAALCLGALPVMWTLNLMQFLRFAGAKENAVVLQKRTVELSDEKLIIDLDDGTRQEIRCADVFKIERTGGAYLLFFALSLFTYWPESAFASAEDRRRFEAFWRARALKV